MQAALAAAFIAPHPPPRKGFHYPPDFAQNEPCGFAPSGTPSVTTAEEVVRALVSQEWFGQGGCWMEHAWTPVPCPAGYTGVDYGSNDTNGFHHHPTSENQITIGLHIGLRDEGDYSRVDSPWSRERRAMMIDHVSENHFEAAAPPSDPAIADPNYYLQNKRIRLKLVGIVFRDSSWWWSANNDWCANARVMSACSNAALTDRPDLKDAVLWHVVGPWSCGTSSGSACRPDPGLFLWNNPAWVAVKGSEYPSFRSPGD